MAFATRRYRFCERPQLVSGRIGATIEGDLHFEVTRILDREFLEVVAAGEQRGDSDDENYDNRSTHVHIEAQPAGGCDAGRPDADERPDDRDVVVIERAVHHQPVGMTAAKSERDAILWSHDPKDLEARRR
jgi:hypothetical protein